MRGNIKTLMAANVQLTSVEESHLIALVRENECLWNTQNRSYHGRGTKKLAWEKIGATMNCPASVLIKRFHNLKSTFFKNLKKIKYSQRNEDGNDYVYSPTWEHWMKMQFLTPDNATLQSQSNSKTPDTVLDNLLPQNANVDETLNASSSAESDNENSSSSNPLMFIVRGGGEKPKPKEQNNRKRGRNQIENPTTIARDDFYRTVSQTMCAKPNLCTSFGTTVALMLQDLSKKNQIRAITEIQGILAKYSLEELDK